TDPRAFGSTLDSLDSSNRFYETGKHGLRRSRENPEVGADPIDTAERQLQALVERIECRQVEHSLRRVAEKARIQIEQELVDAAFAHERAVQPETGFDVQLVYAALRERTEHSPQIDLAARIWLHDMLSAFERSLWLDRRENEHLSATLQDLRAPRNLEPAVDDDAQRLARRLDVAHGEARVIRLDRTDPGQDRAGTRAPAMAVL